MKKKKLFSCQGNWIVLRSTWCEHEKWEGRNYGTTILIDNKNLFLMIWKFASPTHPHADLQPHPPFFIVSQEWASQLDSINKQFFYSAWWKFIADFGCFIAHDYIAIKDFLLLSVQCLESRRLGCTYTRSCEWHERINFLLLCYSIQWICVLFWSSGFADFQLSHYSLLHVNMCTWDVTGRWAREASQEAAKYNNSTN